jgi:hypothetical protein
MNDARAQSEDGEGQREAVIVRHDEKSSDVFARASRPVSFLFTVKSQGRLDEERVKDQIE